MWWMWCTPVVPIVSSEPGRTRPIGRGARSDASAGFWLWVGQGADGGHAQGGRAQPPGVPIGWGTPGQRYPLRGGVQPAQEGHGCSERSGRHGVVQVRALLLLMSIQVLSWAGPRGGKIGV